MEFIIFLILVACGLIFGKMAEKKHYKSILEREEKTKNIVVLSDKTLKWIKNTSWETILITAGTVIAIDYFKKLMSSFVNFFGGRMKSYEILLDRARREATIQVKEKAIANWYNCIANLRIETSSISKNAKQNVWAVEAMAYATAVKITPAWK